MLQPLFWAETPQCVAKTQGCCWGLTEPPCWGKRLHCGELLPSVNALGRSQTHSHPGRARLLSPARCGGFCRDLSLALRMLARIGERSRKLFLHREGAAAGRWPQAISPGLHHGLISSFASLGMGLGGGCVFKGKAQPVSKQDSKTSLHPERGVMGGLGGFTPC